MYTLHEILMTAENAVDALDAYNGILEHRGRGSLEIPYTQAAGIFAVADWLIEDVEIDSDTHVRVNITAQIPVVMLTMEMSDQITDEVLDILNDPKNRPPEVLKIRTDMSVLLKTDKPTITFVVGPGKPHDNMH